MSILSFERIGRWLYGEPEPMHSEIIGEEDGGRILVRITQGDDVTDVYMMPFSDERLEKLREARKKLREGRRKNAVAG